MSSIMTNASAMTALKSLQMTNKSLESTQARISTGFRVAQASDNAAYWSIATTMRSDNKAMATVQDALGLGAAQVDVAYTAMDATKDTLDTIKTKLVAASQPGVDKAKIQSEITQLQSQLESIASAASFSGTNWLSVDSSSASYSPNEKVVSSFTRSSNGSVSVATIDIDITGTALFDAKATAEGILDGGKIGNTKVTAVKVAAGTAGTAGPPATAGTGTSGTWVATNAFTLDGNDAISFTVTVDGGAAQKVLLTKGTIDRALGTSTGAVANAADYAKVFKQAVDDAGVTGLASNVASATAVTMTSASTGTTSIVAVSAGTAVIIGVDEINITTSNAQDISFYIGVVDSALQQVTTAASDLGAVKSRISMQKDFVSNLMSAVERGVGALVDADMNQESTRLQALQVQQQLGIQALSIANGNAQQILSLFR